VGVRMGKQVKRLEAQASAAAEEAERASCGYVISYTPDNVTVSAEELGDGDLVALDVHAGEIAGTIRTVERVTRNPDDLGYVYSAAGVMIGRLLEVRRPFFSYCLRDDVQDPWGDGGPDPGGVEEGDADEDGPG
jgi:hypothetical protein